MWANKSLLRPLMILICRFLRFYLGFADASLEVRDVLFDVEVLFELLVLTQLWDRYDSMHWGWSLLPIRSSDLRVDSQNVAISRSRGKIEDVNGDFALTIYDFGLVNFAFLTELVLSISVGVRFAYILLLNLHVSRGIGFRHTFVLIGLHVFYISIHLEIQQLLISLQQFFARIDIYHTQFLDPVKISAEILAII